MKLYATVSSERASKGQGGNEKLELELFIGSKNNSQKIARILLIPSEYLAKTYELRLYDKNGMYFTKYEEEEQTKGEKKKDEQCTECNSRDNVSLYTGMKYGDKKYLCYKCYRGIK